VLESPVEIVQVAPANEQQADAQFGVDFPGLIEAPLLSEDPLLEDPVSSGGDSSLYAAEADTEGEPADGEGEE
jgi:hypothetical protein